MPEEAEPVWIDRQPEIYIDDDGIAHISERSGDAIYHMAMLPNMLLATAQLALSVYGEWEGRQK